MCFNFTAWGSDCPWAEEDKEECDGYREVSYEPDTDEDGLDIDTEQEAGNE